MASALEKIRAKYERKETVADDYGRIITVRPLTTSQQVKVREMAVGGDPGVVGILTLAASVMKIDNAVFAFPRDRKELDGMIDALDEKGLEACATAHLRFVEKTDDEAMDAAKNLPATDNSET